MLHDFITSHQTFAKQNVNSRKRVLQTIARAIEDKSVDEDFIFDQLMARERLGSTGLGEGVAIPHCRVACAQMEVVFITLKTPIDYESADGQLVDIFVALIVPEHEKQAHLDALANLSTVFSDANNLAMLRTCSEADQLAHVMKTMLAQLPRKSA